MTKHNDPKLIPELICSDYQASLQFYRDILGFRIEYDRAEEGFAMLEYQGSMLMIDQINLEAGKRSWVSGDLEKPYGRGINLQMEISGIDALYQRVKNSHADIFMEIEDKEYRCDDGIVTSRQFITQDPDGYLLRFFEDVSDRG